MKAFVEIERLEQMPSRLFPHGYFTMRELSRKGESYMYIPNLRKSGLSCFKLLILAFIMALAFVSTFSTMNVHATASKSSLTRKTVHMYFNCQSGSAAFKKYVIQHHLCFGTTNSTNSLTPQNELPGDCGDSYIFANPGTSGFVSLLFGADSVLGPITGGSALVSGIGGSYAYPVSANASPYSWQDQDNYYLDGGSYRATLNGGAEVIIGGIYPATCYFEGATASFSV